MQATFNLSETVGSNAAVHFFRGLRHRNLAAMKLATKSGMTHIHGPQGERDAIREKTKAFPLVVNGFRTNPKDSEGHVLFFDVEALIVQGSNSIVKLIFLLEETVSDIIFFLRNVLTTH